MIEFDEDTALVEIEMTPEKYERLEKMAAAEKMSVEEYVNKLAEKAVSEYEEATEQTEQIELNLPEDLYNDLSILAVVRGVSLERLIVNSLDEYIKDAVYQLAEEVYKYFTDKYKKEE